MCGDGVFLIGQSLPQVDIAVLDDGDSVAEDEVDGAIDVAVTVELAVGVDVEGVLVASEAAIVENRVVRSGKECHCLVIRGPSRVLECYALGDEAVATDTYVVDLRFSLSKITLIVIV